MRPLRYNVATSLDGFIAPPDESTSWIVDDSAIDFAALYAEFDYFVMGRKTFELLASVPPEQNFLRGRAKQHVAVVSRSLDPGQWSDVTILKGERECLEWIQRVKEGGDDRTGAGNDKGIWLMGGGWLAAKCLEAGLLDTVEAAVMPVVLGRGFKMIEDGKEETSRYRPYKLVLRSVERMDKSGILMTKYDVVYE
ncbi:hypothetical protein VTO42DRAFT_3904 [Malbranchea cinnamomea]